jgi:hypothetical protein
MAAEFLTAEMMNELHRSGETVFAYQHPYKDMPQDFVKREHALFDKLTGILTENYGANKIYISLSTWADLVIRTEIDMDVFGPELVNILRHFTRNNASDHYLSCVVSDFSKSEGGYVGSFGFNGQRLLVEQKLKALWIEKIGANYEWQPWDVTWLKNSSH